MHGELQILMRHQTNYGLHRKDRGKHLLLELEWYKLKNNQTKDNKEYSYVEYSCVNTLLSVSYNDSYGRHMGRRSSGTKHKTDSGRQPFLARFSPQFSHTITYHPHGRGDSSASIRSYIHLPSTGCDSDLEASHRRRLSSHRRVCA